MKCSETNRTFHGLMKPKIMWKVIPVDTSKYRQAIGYIRLSDRGADGSEVSLARQESEIRRWCESNGLELVAVRSDIGKSGRKLNRNGLNEAISECALRNAILISYSLDRICRDRKILERLKNERVAFRAMDVPEANEMLLDLMMIFAEMYSKSVSTKMKAYHKNRRERAARGEVDPHPVPSHRPDPAAARETVAVAREAKSKKAATRNNYAWAKIKPMVADGKSHRQIARELNEAGFVSARNKPWSHVAVARIVAKFSPAVA